jgi:hypothetical protein
MTILTLVDVLVRTLQEQATSNHVSQLKLGAIFKKPNTASTQERLTEAKGRNTVSDGSGLRT